MTPTTCKPLVSASNMCYSSMIHFLDQHIQNYMDLLYILALEGCLTNLFQLIIVDYNIPVNKHLRKGSQLCQGDAR